MVPDRSLIAQMDASVMDYWGAYALARGGAHVPLADGLFMQTAIPHSLFNSVILSEAEPDAVGKALDLAAECAKTVGVPVLWRIGPLAQDANLSERLENAGLQAGEPQPAMLADLADLPRPPHVDRLRIATATGSDERSHWGRLAIAAFELDETLAKGMGDCEATIPTDLFPDHQRYTAYLDGEPVAISSLVMTGNLAGIYAVATLAKARKRGIGTLMTLHAMAEGKRRGASQSILQASPMGRPVYEKIGFQTVFSYQTYLQG